VLEAGGTVVTADAIVVTADATVVTADATVVTADATVVTADATVVTADGTDDGNTSRWLGRQRPIHLEVIPSPWLINLASSGRGCRDPWN